MNMFEMKKTPFVVKNLFLLTLMGINHLYAGTEPTNTSPFYPIPAYLSSKAATIKPNVMLMVDTSGSMGGSKITTAKSAYTDLVKSNPDLVRWGFSTFHVKDFIPIQDNNADTVVNQISKIVPSGNTPTVPMYYQLIRYFEGLTPTTVTGSSSVTYYGDWAKRTNDSTTLPPFQYRCQKNFIISLSDGDANVVSYLTEREGDTVFGPLSTVFNAFPAFTGKAYEHDFKTGGVDAEGKSWDDPNYPVQNIITYTIGFGTGMSASGQLNLEQAAAAGGGKYYAAGDSAALVASLQDALANITAIVRSPAPPAYTSEAKSAGAVAVKFKSTNWSSDVIAYGTNPDGTLAATETPVTIPTGGKRNVWFRSSANGVVSLKNNSSSDTATTFGVTTSTLKDVLAPWLTGTAVATSANRASVFGDVINSDISVTNQGRLFSLSANDGMVHVFKKNTVGSGYTETFSYIPSLVKRQEGGTIAKVIPNLTKANYGKTSNAHRYLVDGGSFYRGLGLKDKHFLVGTTGRGGAGVYALDMADIRDFDGGQNSVIFDKTQNDGGFNNLGYTVSTPIIVKVSDGGSDKWVALVANGYYSQAMSSGSEGRPALYAINLEGSKGSVWKEISVSESDVSTDQRNGLSGVTALDSDSDGYVDFVYAGDLKGDLYRFDLRGGKADRSNVVKIFSGSSSQPITSAPVVYKRRDGKFTVIFGTGSLLEEADNESKTQQAVYGIIDDLSVTGSLNAATQKPVTASNLVSQSVLDNGDLRMLTTQELEKEDRGWKLNLGSGTGERVIYQPVVYGRTVFLTTQIITTSGDALLCASSSASGYKMNIDAETGGMPKALNAHFAGDNYVGGSKILKGFPSKVGGLSPVVLSANGTNVDGQVSFGVIGGTAVLPSSKDPSYAGGTYGLDGREITTMMIATDEGMDATSITGAKSDKKNNNIRRISWREMF